MLSSLLGLLPTIISIIISFVIVFFLFKKTWNTKEIFFEKMHQPKNLFKVGIISFLITLVISKVYSLIISIIYGGFDAFFYNILPHYSQILNLLYYYAIIFILFSIVLTIHYKKTTGKFPGMTICAIVIAILFNIGFYNQLPMANRVTEKENYIKNISNVYNSDGTLKHKSDGSLVLKTDYGQKTVTKNGNNYVLLAFPIIIFGVLQYGLKEVNLTSEKK